MQFVHLHVHTEYSLLDGLSHIRPLINKVKEYGMDAVGLTDHGVLYGAIEFYKQCLKEEVKPIIGMEAYVMKGDDLHTERDAKKKTNANHLLLLAKNQRGYRNLMELTSIAHLDGFYYRPRFDKKTLRKYSDGLICSSACGKGEIPELLINEGYDYARKAIAWYVDTFRDDYYLEVQRHEYDKYIDRILEPEIKSSVKRMHDNEKIITEGLLKLSREVGVPLIATNDVHYINLEDVEAQDALVCIATGSSVEDINRLRYKDVETFYFRSPEEMSGLFPDYPEVLSNTVEIARKCNLEITLGQWFFPKLPDLNHGRSESEILKEQAWEKLPDKFPNPTTEVKERLEFELKVICEKGYAGYFLIMADLAQWARDQMIVTNTRGSAAGSLVSFVLNITSVDPIKYLLPFERFLNPFRPSPPDIDFDIADNKRQDLIDYIVQKFGQEKVAQIGTFGRMMARGSVRDIARVLGYDYSIGDRLSKMIPMGSQGFPMSIERALDETPALRSEYDNNAVAKRILDLAQKVEGSARHASVHAAGVVVAPTRVTDFSPLQKETKGNKIITQYEMHACEDVGLIKFDVLGITFLTILDRAIELVERTKKIRVDLQKIPLDDQKTFEMLSRGETVGVFQLVSGGITKWTMDMKPTKVEDLMAMVALYRPGPMANIQHYIARKHGKEEIRYFHPKVKKFLEPSYGILVYQDDLLYTAIELAGYDWAEVDKFRKAVGKKIPEEMAKQHVRFVKGCMEYSRMTKDEAEAVWNLFEPFQGYGFNKAHSASYGIIAYYTAYMKANYPVEYMTAMMTADAGDTDKVAVEVNAAREMGIEVLGPDINESDVHFTVVKKEGSLNGQAIRFGLSAIKNVGEAAVEEIVRVRNRESGIGNQELNSSTGQNSSDTNGQISVVKPFSSLTDFFYRVDGRKVNKKVLESLIKAGTFDKFGNRAALLAGIDNLRILAEQMKKRKASGQVELFSSFVEAMDNAGEQKEALRDIFPEVREFTQEQKLEFEKELLGFYLTDNPLEGRLASMELAVTHKIKQLNPDLHVGQVVKIGGVVVDCRVVTTKKSNQQMAFAVLEDQTGKIDLVIFPKTYMESKKYWNEDALTLVEGRVEYREEALSLIVNRVIEVGADQKNDDNADRNSDVFANRDENILVIPKGLDRNKLVALNSLLLSRSGDDRLTLIFENGRNGGRRVRVPFGVDYSKKVQKEVVELLKQE